MTKRKLVILASGTGSNTLNIIGYFKGTNIAEVILIASNKKNAGVLNIASEFGIKSYLLEKNNFSQGMDFLELLKEINPDLIILAGFLLKVPAHIVEAFPNRIINIHPALLPKYGGNGMYGHFVHEAVYENNENESGITIHYVNSHYDEGAVIFQKSVPINHEDTPTSIESKVRKLEIECFPLQIELLLRAKYD